MSKIDATMLLDKDVMAVAVADLDGYVRYVLHHSLMVFRGLQVLRKVAAKFTRACSFGDLTSELGTPCTLVHSQDIVLRATTSAIMAWNVSMNLKSCCSTDCWVRLTLQGWVGHV